MARKDPNKSASDESEVANTEATAPPVDTTEKPKRTRSPNKPKAPVLDAQDFEVLLNHYDQAYTTARMNENVSNEELMGIYERLKKVRALTAPSTSAPAQSTPE